MAFGAKSGTYSRELADTGVPMTMIPGDGGIGPISAIVIVSASGLPPSEPAITIQLFPSGKFTTGTDINGNISTTCTFVNNGDDKSFGITGGGFVNMEQGFWNQRFRAVSNSILIENIRYDVQFNTKVLADITGGEGPPQEPPPNTPVPINVAWDEEFNGGEGIGTVTLQITQPLPVPAGTNSIIVEISQDQLDWFFWGSIPFDPDDPQPLLFDDYAFLEEEWCYRLRNYNSTTDEVSLPSGVDCVDWADPNLPDLSVIGSGGIDFGGAATIIMSTNASGIYTLVPGKTNDTLYDGSETIDVKIPDPFVITGFIS